MKIATQLLSTSPSPVTKTGTALDSAASFQGVLTAATTKDSGSRGLPQVKGKLQTPDAKSQATETTKRSSSPVLSEVEGPVLNVQADAVTPLVNSLPPNRQAPTQSPNQISDDSHSGAEFSDGRGTIPSPTLPISPAAPLSTNILTTRWNHQKTVDGALQPIASLRNTPALPTTDGTGQLISNGTSPHPESQATQLAVDQSVLPQIPIPSITDSVVPVTPVSSSAAPVVASPAQLAAERFAPERPIAVQPIEVAKTASGSPVIVSPVASPAPVAAAKSAPEDSIAAQSLAVANEASALPITFPAVASTAPVAVAKSVPEQQAAVQPLAAASEASALPVTFPAVASTAPVAVAKSVPEQQVAVQPLAAAKMVSALPVTHSFVASPAPVAAEKSAPENSIAVQPLAVANTASALPVTFPAVASTAPVAVAKSVPEQQVAVQPLTVANTASTLSNTVPSVASLAPVVAAATLSAASATFSADASPYPVAAADTVPSSPVVIVPVAPTASIAVTSNAPSTAVSFPPIASSAPIVATKTTSPMPFPVSTVGGELAVRGPSVTASTVVTPHAPVIPVQTGPATSGVVPAVRLAVPVAPAPIASSEPVSQSATPRAAETNLSTDGSKAIDRVDSIIAVPVIASVPSAEEQAVVTSVQSLSDPISLPSLTLATASQASPAVAGSQTLIAGRATGGGKGTELRQTPSATKSKPVSETDAPNGKSTESTGTNTQTESASTSVASLAPKVPGVPQTGNQNAVESASTTGTTNIQQIIQPGMADVANHTPQTSQNIGTSAEASAHAVPAQTVPDSQPMPGVSSAQLIQSMRSSEMKLGMQSVEFGNISINTSLNRQALSAQIFTDHSELGRALAVHLPAIEEKLGSAYGVQARVELRESNNPSSSNDSGYSNSGQQSKEQRQSQGGGSSASTGMTFERIAARASFTPFTATATASRLDIRI